jgi:hypothetical protein
MRLQWSEIRAKAAAFSQDFKDAKRERGETQTFYNAFFKCFGVNLRQVATYEARVRNLPKDKQGFIDLLWPGTLIVEQKSAGRDLRAASNQALDYFDWLPTEQQPRYILTCDFQRWQLVDLDTGREWAFRLSELKDNVEAFAFILGVQPRLHRQQSPANVKASQLMGQLHEALSATDYGGHDLEVLLVRLLFILFADDTRIFNNKDQFFDLIERRTAADGSDTGRWLGDLFEVLNTPSDKRQSTLDADLAEFPYINGRLFEERIRPVTFDNAMRSILLDACEFDWGEVSPAIFGGLFESVIDKVTRRKQGAHYTPEDAILRLIGPLFLDELQAEFARCKALRSGKDEALARLHDRLASLTFLDPACGAGNFLVLTYRELRELEREIIEERFARAGSVQQVSDVAKLSRLNVDQFFGIEIDEFPARIAEVALWMTDHIANTRLGEDFGVSIPRIPLVASPGIHHGDALEMDWNDVLHAERCSYVLGNPPFVGAKNQSDFQRAQVRRIANLGGSGGTLDYVAAWFLKAGDYVRDGQARIAFVSTNSIVQGEQVAQLWPTLFHRKRMEIAFAHRTFAWPGKANVHCVIVGLATAGTEPSDKRLFSYIDGKSEPIESRHTALTAYLFDANEADRHLVVEEKSRPINGAPNLIIGSKPVDGGYLIFDANEFAIACVEDKTVANIVKPYIGAEEFLNGGARYIVAAHDVAPVDLRNCAPIRERLQKVRQWRLGEIDRKIGTIGPKRGGNSARALANSPSAFHVTVVPNARALVVPENGSEKREYVPAGWLEPPTIPSSLIRVAVDAEIWHFALIVSRMHMAWLNHIGGKLKSDPRYSIGLVYNTFPWPDATTAKRRVIEALGQNILDVRALPKNAASSLADLYDPNTMPSELRKAHRDLDMAVDKLYRAKPFGSDRERVEHLFPLYEALVNPVSAAPRKNRRTNRRVARKNKLPE